MSTLLTEHEPPKGSKEDVVGLLPNIW
jgi:hypothetical protein